MKIRCALVFWGITSSAFAQFAGPAILSRGEAPASMAVPQISFRPYLEVLAGYDTGLAGISVTSQGTLPIVNTSGVRAVWGVSGAHSWHHTKIGLDYHGAITHYSPQSYYDSTDQSLLLGITHQFTRHILLTLRETAGTFSSNYNSLPGLAQVVPFDPVASFIPATDFFDNRTIYLTTQADLSIQKSARLSFDFGGDGVINRRRSTALAGVIGAVARGDVQYRLTSKTTIGGVYQYVHFDYNHVFGGSDIHSAMGSYSIRLSRTLEFSAYGGIMRVESKFIQSAPVDPVIAVLLGISNTFEVVHGISIGPNVSARLSKRYGRGVFYVTGGHNVNPGNGLFLTSTATSVGGGYTYTARKRWAFGTAAAYVDSNSSGPIGGRYADGTVNFNISRQISRAVHLMGQFNLQRYGSPVYTAYNRWVTDSRIGFAFAPGDLAFRIW